jgi:hypothetical protein
VSTFSIIGKFSVVATIIMMLVSSQPRPASAFEPVYEIRAKNGTDVIGDRFQKVAGALDPENFVRIGVELGSDLWIGYDSEHGLAMVLDF